MAVVEVPAFHRGAVRVPADGLVTTPLGYMRDEINPGDALPVAAAGSLAGALERCDEVVLSFDGKLGDTLLALGAVAAVLTYLDLIRPDRLPAIRTRGPHRGLFDQLSMLGRFDICGDTTSPPSASTVLIGDRQGLSTIRDSAGRILDAVDCDPEEPPCWSSGQFAYPFLPARYFLSVERQLGVRPADHDRFMPTLLIASSAAPPHEPKTLRVGIVTATSWPVRKDYGAPRFLEAIRSLASDLDRQIEVLIAPGKEHALLHVPDAGSAALTISVMHDLHYSLIARNLATCDLVVGNDTGLTHLAAATRLPGGSGPQVIGLHARHSHTKWRTGLDWHHALATPFSERMHREDLCPVRDRIDDRQFGSAADIGSIQTGLLLEAAKAVLEPGAEVDR
jgi:hypothetical protein